jgi:hypothetical protein
VLLNLSVRSVLPSAFGNKGILLDNVLAHWYISPQR